MVAKRPISMHFLLRTHHLSPSPTPSARTPSDVITLQAARAALPATCNAPLIALAMGGPGRLSRALNMVLAPVTHEALPAAAAPGQLSVLQM